MISIRNEIEADYAKVEEASIINCSIAGTFFCINSL